MRILFKLIHNVVQHTCIVQLAYMFGVAQHMHDILHMHTRCANALQTQALSNSSDVSKAVARTIDKLKTQSRDAIDDLGLYDQPHMHDRRNASLCGC